MTSMKNISIKSLLKEYDPFDIEKALIVNHIRHYQYSLDIYPALCEYVSSSNVNQKLADDIAALHHVSLDDIIIDWALEQLNDEILPMTKRQMVLFLLLLILLII